MADATTIDKFPKATVTKAEVEEIQKKRVDEEHATSCVLTEDSTNWILTTVWPGGC
jgi:hypothetical protein